MVYGDPVGAGDLAWLTLYAAAYSGAAVAVAVLAFSRRELR